MKRLMCLILSLMTVFCSCNQSTGTATESETAIHSPHQKTTAVSTDTADPAQTDDDDDEPLAAVRYENQYEIKEITDAIVGNSADKMYVYNGYLYHISAEYKTDEDMLYAVIHLYDAEGQLAHTDRLPLPENADGLLPHRIFKLSDGRYLIFHTKNSYQGKQDGVFQLLDAGGTVLYRYELNEIRSLSSAPMQVYEEEDEGFSVVYHAEQKFIMLDETLTQQACISTNMSCLGFTRMDDNNFAIWFDSSMVYRINVLLGYCTVYGLRLPKSYQHQPVFPGETDRGVFYITVPNGIYFCDRDHQPKQILSWFDLNLPELDINDSTAYDLYIFDRTHLYICYRKKIDGRVSDVLYHITISNTPVSRDRTKLVLECLSVTSLPWLETVVREFNLTNREYSVQIKYISDRDNTHEDRDALFQQKLLSSSPPDIWISTSDEYQQTYFDKNAFLDLMPLLGDRVLGSVLDAYVWNDVLYMLPVCMWVQTLVTADTVCDTPLTWEKLYEITENISDSEVLTTYPLAETLFSASMMDFVDFENHTSEFHSPEYQQIIEYLQTMDRYCEKDLVSVGNGDLTFNGEWGVSNGMLIPYIRNGSIKLMDINMKNIQAYSVLRLLYGDTPFTICGYPSRDGEGCAEIYGFYAASVLQSTKHPEGCLAFIDALFSAKAQTAPSLMEDYLPVTRDGMIALLDSCRYQYYQTQIIEEIEAFRSGLLPLEWDGTSAVYLDDFGYAKDTSKGYTVLEYTERDKEFLFAFFEGCSFGKQADKTVASIVKEELSYYAGQARSLSETTKIIDSRVWIYLNE